MADWPGRLWARLPFYSVGLAAYPALALASANDELLAPAVLAPMLLASLLAALGLLLLFRRLTGDLASAGGVLALALLLFFSYGHVAMLLGAYLDPLYLLPWLWLVAFLLGARWIVKGQAELTRLTGSLNAVAVVLLLLPAYSLLQNKTTEGIVRPEIQPVEHAVDTGPVAEPLPDVYFIVLDGYARADVLDRIYDYNNEPFLHALEAQGFYVAESSYANYSQTVLSLPATLNLSYLQQMEGPVGPGDFDFWSMVDLNRDNRALQYAERAGYETVAFKTEHALTEIRQVDVFLQPPGTRAQWVDPRLLPLSETDRLYLETTGFRPLLRLHDHLQPEDPKLDRHRRLIRYVVTQLPQRADEPQPQFVFAHVLAPHPPFVFEADGSERRNISPYTISDASHWLGRVGTRREYIEGYREQLPHVNRLVLEAVRGILARSTRPPIIVLQSDHGPGAYFDWDSQRKSDVVERMGILTAVYLPPELRDRVELYPEISPVNTMRLVFNAGLDAGLAPLPDRAYFSVGKDPFVFTEVTEELGITD